MPVKIKSLLISRPIVVPLTTGTTLRLSPGETSAELPDVEITNNPKVDKLQAQGAIGIEKASKATAKRAEREANTPSETSKDMPTTQGEGESRPRSRRRAGSAG
jgi:hypothetical protein